MQGIIGVNGNIFDVVVYSLPKCTMPVWQGILTYCVILGENVELY